MSDATRSSSFSLRYLLPERWRRPRPVVPVVRLAGAIGMGTPLRPGLALEAVNATLERAFGYKKAAAVAILVNSPGGSPVQSNLIFNRIRALADKHDKPVYVFAEDVAASGGYFIALAGDEIYADPSSVVGSIGVVSAGFGFVEAIAKIGVERRIYTSGESKATLDPFQPEKAEDVERLRAAQEDVHETFKDVVRRRRGARLKADDDTLFTGAFWSGVKAVELGLVDGLGDLRSVMRAKLGERVSFRPVGRDRGLLKRLGLPRTGAGHGFGSDGGATLAEDVIATIETRALWSRFGL